MWDVNDENFLYSFINYLNFKIGFFLWNVFDSVFNFIDFWLNIIKKINKKIIWNLKYWLFKW